LHQGQGAAKSLQATGAETEAQPHAENREIQKGKAKNKNA
jgi:hypothetical protein